ncbi:MAG: substrate-binding domain-containing protein [Halobacteria archaeon]|nr:substrate-binding domain-containing protein [Halobacteria archaeon]
MKIQRRRLLQAIGVGTLAGLTGCLSFKDLQGSQNEPNGEQEELVLATTTSTYDTGLLDELNPVFEDEFDATVKTLAKGTGASLRTARDGDADVVLVHARGAEDKFMKDGFGVNRRDVMFNDFVVVGPQEDPAGINGMKSATKAFERIAREKATFVSRGDDSGTNKKELSIWEETGLNPQGTWYHKIGKGMGDTLIQADQQGAYTLSDRGTFLSMKDKIDLVIHVQGPLKGGPQILKNPYGVIPVNPAKHSNVNYELAMAYAGFLTSPEGQSIIDNYTANGSQLFFPNALSEDPNFQQYVPQGWSPREAENASMADLRFANWVEKHVPDDF